MPPRHDFFQNDESVTVAIYLKGLNSPEKSGKVGIEYNEQQVSIRYPDAEKNDELEVWDIQLNQPIKPEESSHRILGTKLKLAKRDPVQWSSLFKSTPDASQPLFNKPTINQKPVLAGGPGKIAAGVETAKKKKNWDQLVEGELDDKEDSSDPNAGGDQALQKFFSQIYGNADDDTKRAMIKSFTESGGTTLSTDWSSIGKESTPIRPPDGMEAKKY